MNISIKHSGTIVSVEKGTVRVRITQASACGTCQIAQHCTASEKQEKIVEIKTPARALTPGDEVVVSISGEAARDAILFSFGIPLALLTTMLIVAKWYSGSDGVAALTAICSLIPYYIIIGIYRKRIENRVRFTIE